MGCFCPNIFWVWSLLAFSTLILTYFFSIINVSNLLQFFGKQRPAYWPCVNWFVDIYAKDLFYLGSVFICQTLQIVPFISNKACYHSSPCSLNVWMLFHLFWHKILGFFSDSVCFSSIFHNSKFILQCLWPSTGLAYLMCYTLYLSMFMLQAYVTADWWFIGC